MVTQQRLNGAADVPDVTALTRRRLSRGDRDTQGSKSISHKVVLPTVEQVDMLPAADLPAFVVQLAALQTRAAVRMTTAGDREVDDCVCLDAEQVSHLLRCSVDLVRERGDVWGISKVLARDSSGRPTRVVYPKALLRACLRGTPDTIRG